VVTPEGIAAVEAIMKKNRRVTVNEIVAHLDMSRGSAHHIVYDFFLQFYKNLIFRHLRFQLAYRDRGFKSHRGHGRLSIVCVVSSGRGLCDELITRSEESYRL
jgi:hypothetical protein